MSRDDDRRLARSLAAGAGHVLCALREAGGATGERGDAVANRYLLDRLAEERSGDAVLSEESADDPRRLDADRVWIVDPLDGSREFAERGRHGRWRDDFAVHVALWTRTDGLTAGAVALPARGIVYVSGVAAAAPRTATSPLRVAVSRTRPHAVVDALAESSELERVPMGSAGVKAMAVLSGEVDAYVHAGGQYEWDSAAPVAVAVAAGLHASRIDGSPLTYNRASPWLPDLLICRADIAHRLLERIDRWKEDA